MNKTQKWILWAVLLTILALYPIVFGIYYSNVFVTFAIFALFAVTLNLLLGYTGLLSFGHAMFFGTGGYGTAIALEHIEGLPLLPAVLIGVLAAVALALILCPIMVRVSGTAFAMLHLAFGQLMYVLALKLRVITGGEDGVGGFPIPPFSIPGILSIDMTNPLNFYYFAIAVLGLSIWFIWYFTKTPLGSVMVSVRDNDNRVAYMGFMVPQTKAIIYVLAAAFAGVAGSIYALFQNLIAAGDGFHILVSFAPIMMVMVGGIGSFFGPIMGAAIFGIIEELTSRYTERVELVMGLILILVIMFAPLGFLGFLRYIKERWFGKRPDMTTTEDVA
ncbi:MAG: branched-chain amino acid ABC transporter permease [Deltaproteobacteria bacterium]|jgi:branched-chain amino acid transport system permease protein|nr:MAG: branched-chain amino acid ABC transporter permease [Deltaproteobacteria bacterium]